MQYSSCFTCEQAHKDLFTVYYDRKKSLVVLSIEFKCTKALNLDKFVKRFAEQYGNHQIQLLQV